MPEISANRPKARARAAISGMRKWDDGAATGAAGSGTGAGGGGAAAMAGESGTVVDTPGHLRPGRDDGLDYLPLN